MEKAVLGHVAALARKADHHTLQAVLRETDSNMPCRQVFAESGFAKDGQNWSLDLRAAPAPLPGHIEIVAATAD